MTTATLRPCKYRWKTNDENRFRCISSKIIHSGTVVRSICEICPFCTIEEDDPNTVVNKLHNHNHKPCGCGGPCCK